MDRLGRGKGKGAGRWGGSITVGGREWGSTNIVLVALSHVCVTNRSSLVYPPPLPKPPAMHSLSPCLLGNRVKGWLAGCLVTEKSCNREENRGESDTAKGSSKNQKKGERRGKSHSIAGTVLWECWWGRDLFLFLQANQQAALWMCGRFVLSMPAEQLSTSCFED